MKTKLSILFIILIGLTFYLLTLKGRVGNFSEPEQYYPMAFTTSPLESSHERAPFMQLLSILQDKQFNLTLEKANFGAPDVGYYDDRFYSYFPPGISYLIMPLYLLGSNYDLGLVFAYFTICIFSILSLILLFKIALEIFKFPVWLSLVTVLIFAFGCTSWGYSVSIYQHAISTFLILLSYYSAWKYKISINYGWVWASIIWISYAFSIFIDYPNAFLMLPIMIYFLISSIHINNNNDGDYQIKFRTTIVTTFIFFIIITSTHLYYNKINFNKWTRLSNTFPRYDLTNLEELKSKDTVAITEKQEEVASIFKEKNFIFGAYILSVADDKGIFFYSPIFLLALLGIYDRKKQINLEILVLIGFCIINFILYSSFTDPWGGYAYGPRYLISSMPFLALFIGFWLLDVEKIFFKKIITFILFAFSGAIALLGALTTNAIPPKVEAIPEGLKYNYLFSLDYLLNGMSSSYLFNTFISLKLSALEYYLMIYSLLILIFLIILFIVPYFEKEKNV